MKKYLLPIALIVFFTLVGPRANAQSTAPCNVVPGADGSVTYVGNCGANNNNGNAVTTVNTNGTVTNAGTPAATPATTATPPAVTPTPTGTCPDGSTPSATQGCNLGYTPLEPIPGLISGTNLINPNSLPAIINAIFTIMISAGALMAVLSLTISGVQYMVSGSAGGKNAGRKRAEAALWAILLIAASWLILHTINPNLTNFSLNPCPAGSTGCTIASTPPVANAGTPAANPQTVQATSAQAQQLGLQNNSVLLYNSAGATQISSQIASFQATCAQGGTSLAQPVSGTLVGGNANQTAEVCESSLTPNQVTTAAP